MRKDQGDMMRKLRGDGRQYAKENNMNDWINVNDRLPEKGGVNPRYFLAWEGTVQQCEIAYISGSGTMEGVENFHTRPNYTHWMPLPERPKETT